MLFPTGHTVLSVHVHRSTRSQFSFLSLQFANQKYNVRNIIIYGNTKYKTKMFSCFDIVILSDFERNFNLIFLLFQWNREMSLLVY